MKATSFVVAAGATLIQRFGSALNLNIYFHMLFLDGVYVGEANSSTRFRRVKASTCAELTELTHTIAHRLARYLERQGLLVRDAEHSYLALEGSAAEPMDQLRGHSITYRIALGPQQGRKVFTLQTLPDERDVDATPAAGNVAGFSLHAGVAAKVNQRAKLERLCRYITRPAIAEKRQSLRCQRSYDCLRPVFKPRFFDEHRERWQLLDRQFRRRCQNRNAALTRNQSLSCSERMNCL